MSRCTAAFRLVVLASALGLGLVALGPQGSGNRVAAAQQADPRTVQMWPDRMVGAVDGRLVGVSGVPASQAHPYGVAVADSGFVVRARTYLSFPVRVMPPGTDVLRATLYAYADSATGTDEATLGVYRVVAPWGDLIPSGRRESWPELGQEPIDTSRVRASGITAVSSGGHAIAARGGKLPVAFRCGCERSRSDGWPAVIGRPPGLAGPLAQQAAKLEIDPAEGAIGTGETIQVTVRVNGADGLRYAEFVLEYDPRVLEVIDSDPAVEGIQVELGPFLNPAGFRRNSVAAEYGIIEVAQEAGGSAVSGSGVLATITFRGRDAGSSQVRFADAILEGEYGVRKAWSARSGTIVVDGNASIAPATTATPLPPSTPSPEADAGAGATASPPTSPLSTPAPSDLEGRAVAMNPVAGVWASWDVTTLFRAWLSDGAENYGLAIAPAPQPDADPSLTGDSLLARWASADNPETGPYVVVEYRVLPVTPTPTATPPTILPPAGHSSTARLGGLIALAVAALALLGAGLILRRRKR